MRVKQDEEFFVIDDLALPRRAVNRLQSFELFAREVEAAPVHVFVKRSPADRCFLRASAPVDTIHNPLQHPEIVPKSRP